MEQDVPKMFPQYCVVTAISAAPWLGGVALCSFTAKRSVGKHLSDGAVVPFK